MTPANMQEGTVEEKEADVVQTRPKYLPLWSLQGAVIERTVLQLQPRDEECPGALISLAGKPLAKKRGCVAIGASPALTLQQVLQGSTGMLPIPGHVNVRGIGAVSTS